MCVMLKLCLYAESYVCTSVIVVKKQKKESMDSWTLMDYQGTPTCGEVCDVAGFERGECRGTQ